ncbi:antitoxin [Faecalispora jeddahensis]|nr:antitoxin [Faecalispora jeddahensis]
MMTVLLQIACRTIKRRLDTKESFENIIADYPKLTMEQISEIKEELSIDA